MFASALKVTAAFTGLALGLLTLYWGYYIWGPAGLIGVVLLGPLSLFAMITSALFHGTVWPLLLLVCAFGSWAWASNLEGNR